MDKFEEKNDCSVNGLLERFVRAFGNHGCSTRFAAAVLACSVFVLLASSASAAPAWLSPVTLSEVGTPEDPVIGVDASGDVTAVWQRSSGASYEVVVTTRSAGGAWQAPTAISAPGETALRPRIAVNKQGAAVVVWTSGAPERGVWATVRVTATAGWSVPVELGRGGYATPEARVAIDPLGEAVAVWATQLTNPGTSSIQAASYPADGGVWSAPVGISHGNSPGPPELAVDSYGSFTAIWGGFNVIESAVRPANGSAWEAPSVLSELDAGSPSLAVNADGEVLAAWILAISNSERLVQGDVKPASGSWLPPSDISEISNTVGRPAVAIDEQGEDAAVWGSGTTETSNTVIHAATRPSGGSWGLPTELGEAPSRSSPQVLLDPQGDTLAVWRGFDGGSSVIESRLRPAASAGWQAPVALSDSVPYESQPEVVLDGEGNAVAVWGIGYGFGKSIVQAAGYDAAGPLLGALAIPASGTVGQPLSFSVSPLDVWSSLGATSWSFGDSTTASGTGATHTYSAAGNYRVTLTSADVLGNTSSASATITMVPAPAPVGQPPTISVARLTNRRFRVAKQATGISARKGPLGTRFLFVLSAVARLQITITRTTAGLLRGHSCLGPTVKLRRAHARHCTRTVTAGVLTRAREPQGADSVAFSGRIGSRALDPGSYAATLSASSTAGRSKPVRLSFAIIR